MAKIIKENTNIIILGAWNLGILTPEWFKEQFPDIVKEKEIPIEVALGINSFRFIINNVQVRPSQESSTFVMVYAVIDKVYIGSTQRDSCIADIIVDLIVF